MYNKTIIRFGFVRNNRGLSKRHHTLNPRPWFFLTSPKPHQVFVYYHANLLHSQTSTVLKNKTEKLSLPSSNPYNFNYNFFSFHFVLISLLFCLMPSRPWRHLTWKLVPGCCSLSPVRHGFQWMDLPSCTAVTVRRNSRLSLGVLLIRYRELTLGKSIGSS